MKRAAALPPAFRLEPGSADDVATIVAIMERAFDPRFGEAWTRPQCSGILPLARVRLTIARLDDGAAAGFSLVRTVADEAELLLLAVLPAMRGCGVGSKLIDEFVASARELGVKRLHLEVREGNPAIAMYRANGFTMVGRRPKYYCGATGELFDALTMSRAV